MSAETQPTAHVAVVPNCLRGSASAHEVAAALVNGVKRALPRATVAVLPLADGGDGTLNVLHAAYGGTRHVVVVPDPVGRPRTVHWLGLNNRTAFIESALACGISGLSPSERKPLAAVSTGLGGVLAAAISAGFTEVWLGLGGTAVIDGGAGALTALGARFYDATGHVVSPQPFSLLRAARVDLAPAQRLLAKAAIHLLPDVDVPLSDNPMSFGAQKGLAHEDRPTAVEALYHLTTLLADAEPIDGGEELKRRLKCRWFGAGGGIGFGLSAVAKTTAWAGARQLLHWIDTSGSVESANLAITAEGRADFSTMRGKLPGTVIAHRSPRKLPTALVAASFETMPSEPFVRHYPITDPPRTRLIEGSHLSSALARASYRACKDYAAGAYSDSRDGPLMKESRGTGACDRVRATFKQLPELSE